MPLLSIYTYGALSLILVQPVYLKLDTTKSSGSYSCPFNTWAINISQLVSQLVGSALVW